MNREDPTFKELTGSLEVTCRELRQEGVRANVKHAAVFSPAEENALWDLKVISDHAPVALQRAVFFYIGNDCYTYVENGSKHRSAVNRKETNKVVSVYASPSTCPRCLVYL